MNTAFEFKDTGEDQNDPAAIVTKALDGFKVNFEDRLKSIETKAAAANDNAKLVERLDKLEAKANRPGGARHEGESACDGALREAAEEAGVPDASIRPRLLSVLDLGYWSYTTLVGDVVHPFEPTISDPESHELAWVPVDDVARHPLHPGFAASWERLRALLGVRPAVVVDAANVVGSVPDGWWRDRPGAAGRLVERVADLAKTGVPAASLDLAEDVWFPDWVIVLEGQARAAGDAPGVEVVRAEASGDDAIVDEVHRLVSAGRTVTVVTSDRDLVMRVTDAGAAVRGSRWLHDLIGSAD